MTGGQSRLLRPLLVCSAVLLATTVALMVHSVARLRGVRELEGRLLAQEQLQQQLLASTPSDRVIVPHLDPKIAFVLDPAKKRSTWWAAKGSDYAINSLGLRGGEIGPRQEGVSRLLLVGDSAVFGWKIEDRHRIGDTVERIVNQRLSTPSVEVISVALPAWNVTSQVSFLERHIRRLQPDFIIWNLLRNDIQDVPAAVPPGVLGGYASPHKRGLARFTCRADYQYELPLPSIFARWLSNLEQIDVFTAEHGIPGLLLSWMPDTRAHIEEVLRHADFDLPVVHLPGFYRNHEQWPLGRRDPHPSPWATHAIAVGLIAKLIELGAIPPFELEADEEEIARRWRIEAEHVPPAEESTALLREHLARVPTHIDPTDPMTTAGVVYGIDDGRMSANGLLCVRAKRPVTKLALEISVKAGCTEKPRSLSLSLRSLSGHEVTHEAEVTAGESRHELVLPPCDGPDLVWELGWTFDFADCSGPRDCRSARLRSVHLVTD
jgi:hypothetical protein